MVTADIYHAKDICFLYLFFTQITVLKCEFFIPTIHNRLLCVSFLLHNAWVLELQGYKQRSVLKQKETKQTVDLTIEVVLFWLFTILISTCSRKSLCLILIKVKCLIIANNLGLLSLIDMPPTREAFLQWKAKGNWMKFWITKSVWSHLQ